MTALRQPLPAGRASAGLRRALARVPRWGLYVILLAVFVGPLWSIVAAAISARSVPPGTLVTFPDQPTLSNIVTTWTNPRIAR